MRSHGEGSSEKSEYHVRFKDEDEVNMSCFYNLQKEAWRSQLERAILRSSAVRDSLVAGDSTILSFPSLGGRLSIILPYIQLVLLIVDSYVPNFAFLHQRTDDPSGMEPFHHTNTTRKVSLTTDEINQCISSLDP